ncbi:tRNA (adenine(22)-N(1))-methyltransferase [Acholeplasma hippikon]|uniref:tRNA (Adenine(22)-N(1))-methyltransferase n=1 Tax=Acholeplasma hippikon TaxID=264636 RepID=A0A449BHY2_9MOLU|nr:class I SAM-dependent methyltransferase [Acholeplasma hippikon]VEU82055.1 tRNA (adenine(22)-N(1))-methyltransferase [Acholeplasma hippikon]
MNRIDLIVELTKGYDVVADIGCDHGYVLKYALDKGYIKEGIATDIGKGPLESAKKNLVGYPVKFYLSDGFKKVNEHFDLAIITGMGSKLITDILKESKVQDATYLLGANEKQEVLRQYLLENGYEILDEYVIYDGFYYVFIKVKKGMMTLTDEEIYTGKHLYNKLEAKDYFLHKINHLSDLIDKVHGKRREELEQIKNYFTNALKKVI